jgi:hypothetical protein
VREHGQNTDNLLICGATAFSGLASNLVGALSKGWLRGVDLNHRPLGYERVPIRHPHQLTPNTPKKTLGIAHPVSTRVGAFRRGSSDSFRTASPIGERQNGIDVWIDDPTFHCNLLTRKRTKLGVRELSESFEHRKAGCQCCPTAGFQTSAPLPSRKVSRYPSALCHWQTSKVGLCGASAPRCAWRDLGDPLPAPN